MTRTRHKYGAKPTTLDGIRFASQGEAARYSELKLLAGQALIDDLRLQPAFWLHARTGLPVCRYVADFLYHEDGKAIVEEWKGYETQVFKIKAKWFRAEYPEYELRIVKKGRR